MRKKNCCILLCVCVRLCVHVVVGITRKKKLKQKAILKKAICWLGKRFFFLFFLDLLSFSFSRMANNAHPSCWPRVTCCSVRNRYIVGPLFHRHRIFSYLFLCCSTANYTYTTSIYMDVLLSGWLVDWLTGRCRCLSKTNYSDILDDELCVAHTHDASYAHHTKIVRLPLAMAFVCVCVCESLC